MRGNVNMGVCPRRVIWVICGRPARHVKAGLLNEMTLTNVLFICWSWGLVNPWCSLQSSPRPHCRLDSDILQRLHRLRSPCQHFHSGRGSTTTQPPLRGLGRIYNWSWEILSFCLFPQNGLVLATLAMCTEDSIRRPLFVFWLYSPRPGRANG